MLPAPWRCRHCMVCRPRTHHTFSCAACKVGSAGISLSRSLCIPVLGVVFRWKDDGKSGTLDGREGKLMMNKWKV